MPCLLINTLLKPYLFPLLSLPFSHDLTEPVTKCAVSRGPILDKLSLSTTTPRQCQQKSCLLALGLYDAAEGLRKTPLKEKIKNKSRLFADGNAQAREKKKKKKVRGEVGPGLGCYQDPPLACDATPPGRGCRKNLHSWPSIKLINKVISAA